MLEAEDYFVARELGLEDLSPTLDVDIVEKTDDNGEPVEGTVTAVLTIREYLKFHRDLDREKGDPFNQFFDADGLMTDRVSKVVESIVTERYKGVDYAADGDVSADEDFIQFCFVLDVPAETTPEELGSKFWEETELVRFYNESDPGTFGSPYLFGSLVYDGLRELDA